MSVGNEAATDAVNAGAMPIQAARGWRLPGWLVVPRGDTAVRLVLVGLTLALQNYLEFPRNSLNAWLGNPLASIFAFVALAGSLLFLVLALKEQVPNWRWLRSRRVQVLVLLATLAACPTGLHQLGVIATAGFQAPQYSNDGTTLDHYAAMQLLEGHNPYVTVSIVSANAVLGQDALHTTPLRRGKFATIPWDSYPTKQQIQSTFRAEPAGNPAAAPEFESHISYPALAFLPLVPFVWAGFPSVVLFFALCLLALVALLTVSVPKELRPWILLLALADAPLLDATVTGDLDVFYILLLFVAWRWWRKPLLSTVFLGLALAAKQLAWFFLPFYVILVWRERGWREAVARLAGAAAIFALINLPFVLDNPHAWLAGVLAPEVDPMFPGGNGLIRLSLGGILPLVPSLVYTVLEVAVMAGCIAWYWRYGRRMPELGFVLAVVPLFFAWRSLTTYFYFVALPALVLLLARQWQAVAGMATAATAHSPALAPVPARRKRSARLKAARTLPRRLRTGRS